MQVIIFLFLLQVRVVNGVPPTGDYSFAKYNKVNASVLFIFSFYFLCLFQIWVYSLSSIHMIDASLHSVVVQSVDIIKYTDEEYEKYLTDPVRIMSNCTVL